MSSDYDLMEMDMDIQDLLDSDETPPEAFYLALRAALKQVESEASGAYA